MYTRATSLPKLYIRNMVSGDMSVPNLEHLALSGRLEADTRYYGFLR
jgi:hypothetical protein